MDMLCTFSVQIAYEPEPRIETIRANSVNEAWIVIAARAGYNMGVHHTESIKLIKKQDVK